MLGGWGGDQTLVRMWNDWNFHILGEGTQNAATTLETGSYKPTHLTCVPVIPLQREMKIHVHKKTCKRVFTAAFFIIVKTQEQPKGP